MFVLKILGTAGVVLTSKTALDRMKSEDSRYAWGILIGTWRDDGLLYGGIGLASRDNQGPLTWDPARSQIITGLRPGRY